MGIKHIACVSVTCDRCDEEAALYDDMGTAHYPDIDEARKQLIADAEPEYQWSTEGEDWFCPSCSQARACEAAGGHVMGDWSVPYAGLDEFRTWINDLLEEIFEDGRWADAWERTAGTVLPMPEAPTVNRY